jgi:hypothetical protein
MTKSIAIAAQTKLTSRLALVVQCDSSLTPEEPFPIATGWLKRSIFYT